MRLGFHAPETEEELSQLVLEAADTRTPLEVMGKGTKRELGHAVRAGAVRQYREYGGITLYEPTELVMVAKTGTPLAEIEAALAENDQELAFEPVDIAPVWATARARARSAVLSPLTSPAVAAFSKARCGIMCWVSGGQRAGRDHQVGRPRHEERDRLRFRPACWPARGARWLS